MTYDKSGEPEVKISVHNIPLSVLRSWKGDDDYVGAKFRVDRNPIIDTASHRTLNRDDRTLYWEFPQKYHESLIHQMREGKTLRMQGTVNGSKFTHVFSLTGAMTAIDRARRNARSEFGPEDRRSPNSKDDAYFDEAPKVRGKGKEIGI